MAELANTFEGGTDGVSITTGNSGGASGDAFNGVTGTILPKFQASTAIKGTLGCHADATGAGSTSYVRWNSPGGTDAYHRVYFKIPASLPTGTVYYVSSMGAGNGNGCNVRFNSAGKFEITAAADTALGTSTATFAAGDLVRVEFHSFANASTGTVELRLFKGANVDGLTATETLGPFTANTTASLGEQRAGVIFRSNAGNALSDFDNWAVSTVTWIGPTVAADPPPWPVRALTQTAAQRAVTY